MHQEELLDIWDTRVFRKLPHLFRERAFMFHKLISIYPLKNYRLLGFFPGQENRIYDMKPLIEHAAPFAPLHNEEFFTRVRVDAGGYGISWNDDIDLSANEIYEHGTAIDVASHKGHSASRSRSAAKAPD